MTVCEYLQSLPEDLFCATLLGLMGIPQKDEAEEFFVRWMKSPYESSFGKSEDV